MKILPSPDHLHCKGISKKRYLFRKRDVTKQLNLHGIGNPVVDAGGSGSAITLSADGITLEGFTATGSGYQEAGIMVTSSNNMLIGNKASNNWNGISLKSSSNNKIYNNIFNNKHNVKDFRSINTWNTTRRSRTNIVGGPYLGGNFWAKPNVTGLYSWYK